MESASSTTDLLRVIIWIIFLVRDRAEFRLGRCAGARSKTRKGRAPYRGAVSPILPCIEFSRTER